MILAVLLSTTSSLSAQDSRAYIKEQIREWGSCRNVAITLTGGDLALNGKNAYAASGVPDGLLKALKELNDEGEFIDDVQLTEGGRWLILYGDNGFRWNDIPASLEKKLREYNENEEVVTSVTFNDKASYNKEFIHDLSLEAKQRKIIVINNGHHAMLKTCCSNFWWVD